MSLVDAIKKQNRIHQRVLDMSTYALDDEKVVVEGSLRDERFRPIYELSGLKREAGRGPPHDHTPCGGGSSSPDSRR